MKNILIIHHGQGIGGGLIALLGLIEHLKCDNNVKVLSIFDGIAVDYLRKLGVEVIVPESQFYNRFYSIFIHSEASYFEVIQQLLKFKSLLTFILNKYYFAPKYLSKFLDAIDVVYLNSTFICDWAYAAKKNNKKVVIHVREPLSNNFLGKNLIRSNIRKYCDRIIAITHDNANRINLLSKTNVVYDPVYQNSRNNDDIILPSNEKFIYFAYVGGEDRIKGFEQFVKSLDYLNTNIKIYFLGGEVVFNKNIIKTLIRIILNPYYLKHLWLKRKLKKSKNIIMVGLVDNVFTYFKNVKFLISPFSKPHASLPILEAFSIGLPVIVSDVSSMDELVNEKNGIKFKNGNYKELSSCINNASQINFKNYIALRDNCYDTYCSLRTNEKSINKILESL